MQRKFNYNLKNKGFQNDITFHVLTNKKASWILGFDACVKLNVVNVVNNLRDWDIYKYAKLFSGIGKFKYDTVKLRVDQEVPSVAQHHRKILFYLRKQVEELERNDIIEK